MEKTLENKAIFFTQYNVQKVFRYSDYEESGYHSIESYYVSETEYAELTPLSMISDEDAIQVAKLIGNYFQGADHSNSNHEEIKKYWKDNMVAYGLEFVSNYSLNRGHYSYETLLKTFDFLRSKGYALPWMGLSVADLVSYGWVTLKTE